MRDTVSGHTGGQAPAELSELSPYTKGQEDAQSIVITCPCL